MELEQTDQEQVEELQKWWRENRLALLGGLALGIGALVGWERWQVMQLESHMAASDAYAELKNAVDTKAADRADASLQALGGEHAGSVYLIQGLMSRAALAMEQEDFALAISSLEKALASGPDAAIADLLRVRLARAQWAGGQGELALTTLNSVAAEAYKAQVLMLRGDIEVSRNNLDAARAAYEEVQALGPATSAARLAEARLARLGGQNS